MTINTRIFGEVTIGDDRMIHFPKGIVGFPELTDFALIHDAEAGDQGGIRWMQSMQEPNFAIPVVDPLAVKEDYDTEVNDDLLATICGIDDILVLVTITVPSDITKMTVNLKAPIIINVPEKKACQLIVDQDYPVKFEIYEILRKRKEEMEGK